MSIPWRADLRAVTCFCTAVLLLLGGCDSGLLPEGAPAIVAGGGVALPQGAPNLAPVVDAGADQTVLEGSLVVLAGEAHDADSGAVALRCRWEELSGNFGVHN